MITETYIYGGINKAVFKRGDEYFVLEKSSEGEFETFPLSNFELNDFYLSNPEVNVVKDIRWDENQIQEKLTNDIQKKEALNFFLMGMDTSLNNEIRKEAMELLAEDEFKNSGTQSFLKNRIFATKIPENFNPLSACEIAKTIGDEHLTKLYKDLNEAKDIIITLRDVWKKIILESTFINPRLDSEQLDKEFTDNGIFSDFVIAILTKNYKDIDNSIVRHSDVLKELNISGQPGVLLIKMKEEVFKQLSITDKRIDKKYFSDIRDNDIKYEILEEDDFGIKFSKHIENFKGKSRKKKDTKRGIKFKIPLLSKYFKGDVNAQVLWIKNKILIGNIKKAEAGILKLIEFQDFYSDKEDLCKSLCDIAETFQKINDTDTADLIARKAISLNLNDSVPHCILAENLRSKGKLEETLKAYDIIIRDFNNNVVPKSGRAGTLRQMGEFEEALKAYDEIIRDFKNTAVPRNGRAETLRQMGKLDEALKAYNEIIIEFKNDVVSRSGRAEILRQMGKLDEALKAYDEIIVDFKDDVIPRSGRAETLRQMGKLDEALKAYNEIIRDFKNTAVPRSGRAETLRQMGKLDEALKAYDEIIVDFKNEVIPRTGRAGTLRQKGEFEEALKAYDEIIRDFKNTAVPRSGRAETLRQMGKLDEALKAYDEIIVDFKNDVVPKSGRAETLRQMGKLELALKAYDDLIKSFPYNQIAITARLVLLIQMGKNLNEVENELIHSIPESQRDWVLHHVYCMLLIKQNKLDEAISKLKGGVEKVQDIISRGYYKNALSYAYIRKKQYDKAILNLTSETNLLPLPKVLVTHAYAAEGNLNKSKKYFSEIINSQIKKVDETARYLSDRYQIQNQKFFHIASTSELDDKIETLEFDLITESYYSIAA